MLVCEWSIFCAGLYALLWFGVIRLVPTEVRRQMGTTTKKPLLSVHKTSIWYAAQCGHWSDAMCVVRLGDNFFFSLFGRCSFCVSVASTNISVRTPPIVFGCTALNEMITEHYSRQTRNREKKKKTAKWYGQSKSTYKNRKKNAAGVHTVNSSNADWKKKVIICCFIYVVVCPLSDRFKLKTSLIISYVKSCVLSCTSIFTVHTYMHAYRHRALWYDCVRLAAETLSPRIQLSIWPYMQHQRCACLGSTK